MATATKKTSGPSIELLTLRPEDIHVEKGFNPRTAMDQEKLQALADSLVEHGLLNPLIVRPNGGKPMLIGGHRRLAAAKLAKLSEVPVIMRKQGGDDLIEAVVDNAHREDLTPVEEAIAFGRLQAQGMDAAAIAKSLSVSQKLVTERLRILDLTPAIQQAITDGHITTGMVPELHDLVLKHRGLADELVAKSIETNKAVWQNPEAIRDAAVKLKLGRISRIEPGTWQFKLETDELRAAIADLKKWDDDYTSPGYRAKDAFGRESGLRLLNGGAFAMVSNDVTRAAIEGGFAIEVPITARWDGDPQTMAVVTDLKWLQETAAAALLKGHKAAVAAYKRSKSGSAAAAGTAAAPAGTPEAEAAKQAALAEQEAKQREKEAKLRTRDEAREFNRQLGKSLRDGMSNLKPSAELLQLLLDVGLHLPEHGNYGAPSQLEVWRLGWSGLRFTDEWTETTTTKGGKEKVAYITDKSEVGKRTWSYLTGGKTADEAAQRIAIVFAAAHYAKSEAAATVKEVDYHSGTPFREKQKELIEKIASKYLPGPAKKSRQSRAAKPKPEPEVGGLSAIQQQVLLARTDRAWHVGPSTNPLQHLYEALPGLSNRQVDLVCKALVEVGMLRPPLAGGYIVSVKGNATAKQLRDAAKPPAPNQRREKVLQLITEHPGITIPELAEKMEVKQNYLYRIVPALQEDGKVIKSGRGWHLKGKS